MDLNSSGKKIVSPERITRFSLQKSLSLQKINGGYLLSLERRKTSSYSKANPVCKIILTAAYNIFRILHVSTSTMQSTLLTSLICPRSA
jgi:hypothetical protein